MKKQFAIIFIITCVFGLRLPASAQSCVSSTCNAASPAESDVLAALPSSGNTNSTVVVNIPGGTAAWTSQLTYTVPPAVTNLTIKGSTSVNCTGAAGTSSYSCAPTDSTVIQDNIAGGFGVWQINGSSSSSNPLVRLTGITIQGGSGAVKGQGLLLFYSNSATSQIRFDHDHFNSTTSGNGAWAGAINGCTTGVIDHNVFDSASTTDSGSVVQGFMVANTCNDSLGYGDGSWAAKTGFGTSGFIFMESNVFNGGLEGDCETSGTFVSRYNTLNTNSQSSSWIHSHATEQNGGRVRGCQSLRGISRLLQHRRFRERDDRRGRRNVADLGEHPESRHGPVLGLWLRKKRWRAPSNGYAKRVGILRIKRSPIPTLDR